MSERGLHSSVVRWLAGLSGLQVIKADQSGDRPPLPYVMVAQQGYRDVREHESETLFRDIDGETIAATSVMEGEWQYSVHVFAEDPVETLRLIKSATRLAQLNEPLLYTLIVHETSMVRYVPEKVGERYEPRAQMDLILRGIVKDEFVVDVIEQHEFQFERV